MDNSFPVTTLKHAIMKLDSFQTDIQEIREEDGVQEEIKNTIDEIAELASIMEASLYSIVSKVTDEEEFNSAEVELNEIDEYPEKDTMDKEI